MPDSQRPLKVFLSYASQDRPVVRELSLRLASEGWIDPWVDEKKLLPGQDWRAKIEEAVETSDIVIVCLSSNSVTKEGHVQKEIRYAREIAFEKPDETIFLIPLRLDDCNVPRGLRFYQWADYFGEKKDETYYSLVESLKLRYEQKLILEEQERIQKEKVKQEITDRIAREKAEREAIEQATREKEAREKAGKAAREKSEREAAEKARREEAERKATEKAAREKAKHDAAEKAKREREERLAAQIGILKETFSNSLAALKSNLFRAMPFLTFAGFAGIAIVLLWISLRDATWFFSPISTSTATVTPGSTTQITFTNFASSPTQTPKPSVTATRMMPATVSPTAIGGGGGKIAFVSDRDGVPEIYVINSDGSGLLKSANNITPKFRPAWSPDGKEIAFVSDTNKPGNLYIMNADGSSPIQLITTGELISDNPAWSPDGKKIAFVGWGLHKYSDLYVINADGSHLISASDHPTGLWSWAWSPDGQKIAFSPGPCAGRSGICVMNADRNNIINLADKSGYGGSDRDPSWSPDGKKIAFTSGRYGNAEVFVMNADGTNQVNLTHYGKAWDGSPTWSPDGKKIVFSSYRDGNYEIYVMNADGTDVMNLTNNPADDGDAIWSPDSTRIAFVSGRDGNSEIYVINVDGTNLIRVTNNAANDDSPVWSP